MRTFSSPFPNILWCDFHTSIEGIPCVCLCVCSVGGLYTLFILLMDVYTINNLRLLEVEFFGQGVWLRILISITSLTSIVASIFRLQVGPPGSRYQTFKSVLILEVKKWNRKIVLFAFFVISWAYFPILCAFFISSSFSHFSVESWVFISICGHSSYTMKINPLSGMLLASVFSHFIFWLYINKFLHGKSTISSQIY